MPAEPGEGHQRGIITEPLTGDTNIGTTAVQQRIDFLRRALNQLQAHIFENFTKRFNHRRQAITRLGVGRGDGQHAGSVVGKEIGQAANVTGLTQNPLGNHQQGFARLGHA